MSYYHECAIFNKTRRSKIVSRAIASSVEHLPCAAVSFSLPASQWGCLVSVVLIILDLLPQNDNYSWSLYFCETFVHCFEFTIVAENEQSRNTVRSKLWMKSCQYFEINSKNMPEGWFLPYSSLPQTSNIFTTPITNMIDTDTNTLYCQNKWRIIFCQEWFKSPVFRHAVLISPNYWRPHWIKATLDHLIPSLLLLIYAIRTKNHDHSTNKVTNLGYDWWLWNIKQHCRFWSFSFARYPGVN